LPVTAYDLALLSVVKIQNRCREENKVVKIPIINQIAINSLKDWPGNV
jgi:hypothetical protein